MLGIQQRLDEVVSINTSIISFLAATLYLILTLHSCGFITLCCSRKKEAEKIDKNQLSKSREARTQESPNNYSDTRLQRTQRTQADDAVFVKVNKTMIAKTQDSIEGSEEKVVKKGKKKKKKGDKLFSSTDHTTSSIKQSVKLPRAPKGQHDEELEEMEMILNEASRMSKIDDLKSK